MDSREFSGAIVGRRRQPRGKSTGIVSRGAEQLRSEGGKVLQWLRPSCCTRAPRTLSNGSSRSPSQRRRPLSHTGCAASSRANCLPCCGPTMGSDDVVSPVRKPRPRSRSSRISAAAAMLKPRCWRALDDSVWDAPVPWSHCEDDSPVRVSVANRFLHGAGDPIDSPFNDVVPSPGSECNPDVPIGMIEDTSALELNPDLSFPRAKLLFDDKTSSCTTEVTSNGGDVADDVSSNGLANAENEGSNTEMTTQDPDCKSKSCDPSAESQGAIEGGHPGFSEARADAQDMMNPIELSIGDCTDLVSSGTASKTNTDLGNVDAEIHHAAIPPEPNTEDSTDTQSLTEKPQPRPKARPPARAAPPPFRKASGAPPASLPNWCGPVPSPEWKADRVVNWQPIRQAGKWNGSVWQVVNNRMQEGFTPLPDHLLNVAFMKRIDESVPPRRNASRPLSARTPRRLSQKAALTADLLYAHLLRKGVEDVDRLAWVTGVAKDAARHSSIAELDEDILECLLGLLRAASGEEGKLLNWEEDASLVPAEAFLQTLVKDAGPLKVLDDHVETALQMSRFPAELSTLEKGLQLGIRTIGEVTSSSSIPVLLEGVLLLGNYVNASCKTLSGAVGVTLDSLVKLAHTRCTRDASRKQSGASARKDNALLLLVEHLQESRPGFLLSLSNDLEGCKRARDLDPKAMDSTISALTSQLKKIRVRLEAQQGETSTSQEFGSRRKVPEALKTSRLQNFLLQSEPRMVVVEQLMKEFKDTIVTMRQWFAENADTGFVDMMHNLATLREALPAVKPQPLPPCPRPHNLRQVGQSSHSVKSRRPRSEPPVRNHECISGKTIKRCSSEPPPGSCQKSNIRENISGSLKRPARPAGAPRGPVRTRTKEVVVQPPAKESVVQPVKKEVVVQPPVNAKQESENVRTPPRRLRALQEVPFSVPKHHASVDFCSSLDDSVDVSKAQEYIKNISAKLAATRSGGKNNSDSKIQVASILNAPHTAVDSNKPLGTPRNVSTRSAKVPNPFATSCSTASEVRVACPVVDRYVNPLSA